MTEHAKAWAITARMLLAAITDHMSGFFANMSDTYGLPDGLSTKYKTLCYS